MHCLCECVIELNRLFKSIGGAAQPNLLKRRSMVFLCDVGKSTVELLNACSSDWICYVIVYEFLPPLLCPVNL